MDVKPRNQPRDLPGGHWYYVNDRSVDVVAVRKDKLAVTVHLRERELQHMLAELKPKRKRR